MRQPPNSILYSFSNTVRTREINSKKELTPLAAIELMQEASMRHVIKLNLSFWNLKNKNLSWVLLKKDVHFINKAYLGDVLAIETYPTRFERYFGYRDYKIYKGTKLIAIASSQWVLFDLMKRRIQRISDEILDLFNATSLPKSIIENNINKISKINTETKVSSYKSGWFDLDWNNHANNLFHIKCLLDSLYSHYGNIISIKRMVIHFKKEIHRGDIIESYIENIEESVNKLSLNSSIDSTELTTALIITN